MEYMDMKGERELIRERVVSEYSKRYGQVMRMYHVLGSRSNGVYMRLEVRLCVNGKLWKRDERVRLYFDACIPYEIIENMRRERVSVSVSKRVCLSMEEDGRVKCVRRRSE